MGYQITWKVKDLPDLSEYKSIYSNPDSLKRSISITKQELIITCMNLNKTSDLNIGNIKFKLDLFKGLLEDEWKLNLAIRLEEEELWFCGWEYSKPDDVGDYTDNIYNDIYMYCYCTQPSDPISNDSNEYFFDKKNKVEELLSDLEESVYTRLNHEFVDKYREYQIKYEDEAN